MYSMNNSLVIIKKVNFYKILKIILDYHIINNYFNEIYIRYKIIFYFYFYIIFILFYFQIYFDYLLLLSNY